MNKKIEVTIKAIFENAPKKICGHAYTLEVNGVSFSASNVFDFGKYDPEIRDRVFFEIKELLNKHGNWVLGIDKERLYNTIKAEVAVNKAARKGLYNHPVGYVGEWLEHQLENALRWMKEDAEGEMIARILLAIDSETYGDFHSRFHRMVYANWKTAKEFHAEELFEKKAAEIFAVA